MVCFKGQRKSVAAGGQRMARLSDSIEEFIKDLVLNAESGEAEIQRNELANRFHCVPSQINYVIATRFSRDKGYLVESRRGGGGCIKICRIEVIDGTDAYVMSILEYMGTSVSQHGAGLIVGSLFEKEILSEREANLMLAAVNDRTLAHVKPQDRDRMRAELLRGMLMALVR